MKTTDFIKGLVVGYMDQGYSSRKTQEAIASILDKYQKPDQMIDEKMYSEFSISFQTCHNIFKQFTSTLQYQDRRVDNGKKSTYTKQDKDAICQHALDNIGLTLKQFTGNEEINPQEVCSKTISNILKEQDIIPYQQQTVLKLSDFHKDERVRFARKAKSWSNKWQKIIFTDECQISIDPQNKYFYIKRGEQIPIEFQKGRINYPIKVHIWAAISSQRPLKITRIQGNLNSQGYVEILKEFFSDQEDFPNDFIYQHDNSAVHTAKIVEDYFDNENIPILSWPAYSPDISPIENVWSVMKNELWMFRDEIQNQEDLFDQAERIFYNSEVIQKTIQNSYLSLQKRMIQIIEQNGEEI